MKLKKLLPLASIAGVAAVVAPLVTSCTSAKTYSYFFDASKPARNWTPKDTTGKAEAVELKSVEEGLDLFFNACKKNSEILADNILYSLIQYHITSESYAPDRGLADITINKVDTKTKKLSFDIKTSITDQRRTEGLNIDVKINSLKFEMGYVWYSRDEGEWILEPSILNLSKAIGMNAVIAYLMSDKEWSCSMNVASQYYLEDKDIYVEYNCNSSWDELQVFLQYSVKFFGWLNFDNLYYMQDVTYNPEA